MSFITRFFMSPRAALSSGFVMCFLSFGVLYPLGFFRNNTYFQWGPPLFVMGQQVDSLLVFYVLLTISGLYQLINSWNDIVTYPYILNEVQDPKCKLLRYSKKITVAIPVLDSIYDQMDMFFVVNGSFTQFSFLLVAIVTNTMVAVLLNYYHVRNKIGPEQQNYEQYTVQYENVVTVPEHSCAYNCLSCCALLSIACPK